jgi:hypothetical protein
MYNAKDIIIELSFNDENFEQLQKDYDYTNPTSMKILIKECEKQNINFELLKQSIIEHEQKITTITMDEIKSVFIKLKEREKNPRGKFDKSRRFYVKDYELLDVREPSEKYPHSQMNAARTAKFVKALAEKYKCQSLEELESVAYDK